MTSEEDHRSRLNIIIGRIRTPIYTNPKLAILISFVLVFFVTHFSSHKIATSPSFYASKRQGLGAGDTTGELQAALRRKGDGRAAVAIIRVIGMPGGANIQYLVQVKSHDYPVESFRGAVSLLGGNANAQDKTPLDTLKRELNEELHFPDWVDALDATKIIDNSVVEGFVRFISRLTLGISNLVKSSQTGYTRNYALAMLLGVALMLLLAAIVRL